MREFGVGLGACMFLAMCAGLFYWTMGPSIETISETQYFVIDVAIGLVGIVLAVVSAIVGDDP